MNKEIDNSTSSSAVDDPTADARKRDHIELAFQSQINHNQLDQRFYYEPVLAAHPTTSDSLDLNFLGKKMRLPLWVSSMTGGTSLARTINRNLARACKDFGMGMGLGSCRSLLFDDEYLADFDVRSILGEEQLLFANLGIAQIEQLIDSNNLILIDRLVDKLQADGLVIHINPFQEWLQPEGDRFARAPLDTIRRVLDAVDVPLIVKEVGQGMGYESLKALYQLPLAAVEFAANGGTNFAKLELLRSDPLKQQIFQQLAYVGHSADEMVEFSNRIKVELGDKMRCKEVIISGGIKNFLDGYYLINKLALSSVYGQASSFLKYAREGYEPLYQYIDSQKQGLALAQQFLRVKK